MDKTVYYDRFFSKKIVRRPTISKRILFREVTRHVRKRIHETPGGTLSLLDVGCGPGHLVARLLREERLDITGADITDHVLEDLRVRIPRARFLNLDFSQPQTMPHLYDIITAVEIFEHIPREQKRNFLVNCSRNLQEGGLLILTTPNKDRRDRIPVAFQNTQPIEDWVNIAELLELSEDVFIPLSIESCIWYFPRRWMDIIFKRLFYPFHMTLEQALLRSTTLGGHIVFRATPGRAGGA